ncbi:MAG: two-component sensor histidine kinase [Saprospiraceae bacterium]|nr:two-component sensor histidine kinase [Bacteroidia bacterium]NNL93282.1 two-component sensor histidine kinase [Saprospiraceae bacterium]
MKKINKYRIFHLIVMTYLVAAFSWWAILLSKKNSEIYNLKKEYLVENNIQSLEDIENEYESSKIMVLGEGLVFAISIIIGLVLIYRAVWAELKLNSRLNNFLLSVTHELKTPITSLNLINRTLANKELDKEQSLSLLNTSYEESLRLESLVNNILTAAQMESAYQFNFESINFSDLVKVRADRIAKIFPHIDMELDLLKTKQMIKGDKEALTKLIDNIIDNAVKYSGDSNQIQISTVIENNQMILSISDFGEGIKDEEKKKILNKFYRVGDENIRQTKGTGLGLFIVKEIAEAHKASLDILDNKPSGTEIKIGFPI